MSVWFDKEEEMSIEREKSKSQEERDLKSHSGRAPLLGQAEKRGGNEPIDIDGN